MPLPPGVVCRLGTPAARHALTGRLSLFPPALRTFVAWDADIRGEYSLDDGSLVRRFVLPEGYRGDGTVSADGSRLMLSSPPAVVDRATCRLIFALWDAEVTRFSFSDNGRFLAAALRGNPPLRWTPFVGGSIREIPDNPSRAVLVYDVTTRDVVWQWPSPVDSVTQLRLSPNGRVLLVAGQNGRWYDPCLALSDGPGGRRFSGDLDREYHTFALVGTDVRELRTMLPLPAAPLVPARSPLPKFTPDGHVFLFGDRDGVLTDLKTGDIAPGPPARSVFSPNGNFVAHLDELNGDLVRRDRWTGDVLDRTPCPFPRHPSPDDLRVRDDGVAVCLVSSGTTAMSWSAPGGRTTSAAIPVRRPPGGVAFTASGREVVTRPGAATLDDPTTRRWDAATGALIEESSLPFTLLATAWEKATTLRAGVLYSAADEAIYLDPLTGWTGEGRWEPIDACEGRVELLRLSGVPVAARVAGTVTPVTDGTFLASWWDDGSARLVQLLRVNGSRCELVSTRALPVVQTSVRDRGRGGACQDWGVVRAWHGKALLVVHRQKVMPHLLDARTGDVRAVWPEPIRPEPLAVHPTRPLVAAATGGGDSLAVFDAATGRRLATLLSACEPEALAWSPDGSRLVASLGDATAVVFDLGHFLRGKGA